MLLHIDIFLWGNKVTQYFPFLPRTIKAPCCGTSVIKLLSTIKRARVFWLQSFSKAGNWMTGWLASSISGLFHSLRSSNGFVTCLFYSFLCIVHRWWSGGVTFCQQGFLWQGFLMFYVFNNFIWASNLLVKYIIHGRNKSPLKW